MLPVCTTDHVRPAVPFAVATEGILLFTTVDAIVKSLPHGVPVIEVVAMCLSRHSGRAGGRLAHGGRLADTRLVEGERTARHMKVVLPRRCSSSRCAGCPRYFGRLARTMGMDASGRLSEKHDLCQADPSAPLGGDPWLRTLIGTGRGLPAALKKRGYTQAGLSIANGYDFTAVGKALQRPWPALERIIANVLGVTPEVIWPSRYGDAERPIKQWRKRPSTSVARKPW